MSNLKPQDRLVDSQHRFHIVVSVDDGLITVRRGGDAKRVFTLDQALAEFPGIVVNDTLRPLHAYLGISKPTKQEPEPNPPRPAAPVLPKPESFPPCDHRFLPVVDVKSLEYFLSCVRCPARYPL